MAALLLVAIPLVDSPTQAARSASDPETRGLWVLRTSLTTAPQIDRLVKDAAAGGINTLFLQIRGRGDAYFAGGPEPMGPGVPGPFDPLAHAIARAHAAGLRVHAWVNVNLVASAATLPTDPNHLVRLHPDWLMVPRELAPSLLPLDPRHPQYVARLAWWTRQRTHAIEGLYVSPIGADAARYLESIVSGLAERYPVDGVHFDYIRYPSAKFDYSRAALVAFRTSIAPELAASERQDLDRRAAKQPFVYVDRFPDRWTHFRRLRLTDFVARLRAAVKTARPEAIVSAAVVPDAREAIEGRLQDWPEWGRRGLIDVVCPMAYTDNLPRFRRQIADVTRAMAPRPQWAGIGAYRLTAAATAAHVDVARQAGAEGIVLFSYDSIGTPATRTAALASIGRLAFPPPRTASALPSPSPDPH